MKKQLVVAAVLSMGLMCLSGCGDRREDLVFDAEVKERFEDKGAEDITGHYEVIDDGEEESILDYLEEVTPPKEEDRLNEKTYETYARDCYEVRYNSNRITHYETDVRTDFFYDNLPTKCPIGVAIYVVPDYDKESYAGFIYDSISEPVKDITEVTFGQGIEGLLVSYTEPYEYSDNPDEHRTYIGEYYIADVSSGVFVVEKSMNYLNKDVEEAGGIEYGEDFTTFMESIRITE